MSAAFNDTGCGYTLIYYCLTSLLPASSSPVSKHPLRCPSPANQNQFPSNAPIPPLTPPPAHVFLRRSSVLSRRDSSGRRQPRPARPLRPSATSAMGSSRQRQRLGARSGWDERHEAVCAAHLNTHIITRITAA